MTIELLYPMMNNEVKFPLMGLLVNETSVTIAVRQQNNGWPETIERILDGNLLDKSRSLSTKRYVREIQLRSESAYDWELDALASVENYEVKQIICYLICMRTYNLLNDFFFEVLLRKYQQSEYQIEDYELRSFLNEKFEIYPRLKELTSSTESRMRTYMIKIFREVGLINGVRTKKIVRVDVPETIRDLYKKNGAEHELRYIIL